MSITGKLVLKVLETGLVPEKVTSLWIRNLLKNASKRASLGETEARHAIFRQILKDLKLGIPLKKHTVAEEEKHEMGADFFELFLGGRMQTSCCYFPTGAETLDEAEDTMLWMTADRAGIREGMKILDLGCGWGEATLWLAANFPGAKITAVTNSVNKRIHIQKKINEKGIKNIEVLVSEFDELPINEKFDRILCIERFQEFFKLPNWENKILELLNSNGKLFLQVQAHNQLAYYNDSVGLDILPGQTIGQTSIVPSTEMILHFQRDLSIEDQWKISGVQYAQTARKWLKRFYANRLDLLPVLEKTYGKRMAWIWFQRWKLYLLSLIEQFGFNRGQDWLVGQYLFTPKK